MLPRFRWAMCQLGALRKCLTIGSLRKTLKTLPKTLDGVYNRILMSIDEEYAQDATKVLQCLVFSARPLRIKEVAEVLAVNLDRKPYFDVERRLPEPRDILVICSSLVTVSLTRHNGLDGSEDLDDTDDSDDSDYVDDSVTEGKSDYSECSHDSNTADDTSDTDVSDNSDRKTEGTEKLRLAHFSVKEYLVSERIRAGPASTFS